MTNKLDFDPITRRDLMRGGLLAVAAAALPGVDTAQAQKAPGSPYAPFKMGIQSYSLRHFSLDDALDKTRELGLTYWEAYPGHMPVTADPKAIADYKQKLAARDIKLVAYGAVDFSNNEADARAKFDFARAMGLRELTVAPSPDSFALLDKLVAEYDIVLGIHNHGPGDNLYDTWEKVMAAIQGHDPRIGACDDTGHYLRSDVSPVTAAAKFGKRLYDVHLKAVKIGPDGQKAFTEIGQPGSLLDTVGLFRVLQNLNYKRLIALEYEEHEEDPMPYLQQCLEAVRRYCATIRHNGL